MAHHNPNPTPRESHNIPNDTTLTTKTLCSSGTNLKLIACTHGQTIQFFCSAVVYVLANLSFGLVPSMMAMLLRKTKRFVDAKTTWSVRTRAAIVVLGFLSTILCCRNLNQVVATGPKTAEGRMVDLLAFGCMG